MAFTQANLKDCRWWRSECFLYNSADAVGTIAGSGYFNNATNQLHQNDVIIAVGSTGGTRTVDVLVVSSATAAATVTCINGT